ncbi:unnamed protein product [Linum tenue]|uniref:Uncharacterized protein n=1 Tax=Linum tenue TaxID=586396 RepID=A0AAV0RNJ8_9ROSI|nr:unnamed protein product [Linum tenue]
MFPDRLSDLETSVVNAVGNTRRALKFACFAHRHGKSYATEEGIRQSRRGLRSSWRIVV